MNNVNRSKVFFLNVFQNQVILGTSTYQES